MPTKQVRLPEEQVGSVEDDDIIVKTMHTTADSMHKQDDSELLQQQQHEEETDFDLEKYPVREFTYQFPFFKEIIAFNPLVSGFGVAVLWGIAIWSMADPEGSNEVFVDWRTQVTLNFTWLFVGSKALFFFFIVFVACKFGGIKLGKPDQEPEFSTGAYFAMIFAAGVAVGLFVYGVSEPLWHQNSHFFAKAGYHSQDEIDMFAINMTVTNWAINGWAPYLIVAVCMGLAGYRFGLPMTFRSCFYPILGHYTWGWIGDLIDGYTIVVTVAGVCTSLGLGAIQAVVGFQYLGWVSDTLNPDEVSTVQSVTIWGITLVATISVLAGLSAGIKTLSYVAFLMGMLLLFLVFAMDDTKFLLNLQVQEIGYYLQHSILELNFWTDAFGQLREGSGRAADGKASGESWMNDWMIFYQAWWVSWSAFVGLFVARISKGRTVGEVILYSLVAPVLYCIMWFCIWGGTGLRQARQAMELIELGKVHFDDEEYFLQPGSTICYDVPQNDVYVNDTVLVFENNLKGITPVCVFDSKNADQSAFNVLYSFSYPDELDNGLGPTLAVMFLISLIIYFATSSDSGSFVVDHLSANGRLHHHWIQRLFWAVTEGAVATALLSAGGADALQAIQAASIVAGLPFAFLLLFLVPSIWNFCDQAVKDPEQGDYVLSVAPEFSFPLYGGIWNVFEWASSLGQVNYQRIERGMDLPLKSHVIEFFKGLFIPFLSLYQILRVTYPRNTLQNKLTAGIYAIFFVTALALFCTISKYQAVKGWAWASFFCAGSLLGVIRNGFRSRFNLRSTIFSDFFGSLFFWPQVLAQMAVECKLRDLPNDKADDEVRPDDRKILEESMSDEDENLVDGKTTEVEA